MNIYFEDSCWEATQDAHLLRLLTTLERRDQHGIFADVTRLSHWCQQQMPGYVELLQLRIAKNVPRTNAIKLYICPTGAAQITQDPPWTLNAEAALPLIDQGLKLFLENNESDWRFLCALHPEIYKWKVKGWIDVQMGGGSAMKTTIEHTSQAIDLKWRHFFMFDSDRLHPDELDLSWTVPSGDGCQGFQFERACAHIPQRHWHRLNRRSIENYLPFPLLRTSKATCATALENPAVKNFVLKRAEGAPVQWDMSKFYNMKKGLNGDGIHPPNSNKAKRAARSQAFWSNLSPSLKNDLENGFSDNIAEEFKNIPPNFAWPNDISDEIETFISLLQDAL